MSLLFNDGEFDDLLGEASSGSLASSLMDEVGGGDPPDAPQQDSAPADPWGKALSMAKTYDSSSKRVNVAMAAGKINRDLGTTDSTSTPPASRREAPGTTTGFSTRAGNGAAMQQRRGAAVSSPTPSTAGRTAFPSTSAPTQPTPAIPSSSTPSMPTRTNDNSSPRSSGSGPPTRTSGHLGASGNGPAMPPRTSGNGPTRPAGLSSPVMRMKPAGAPKGKMVPVAKGPASPASPKRMVAAGSQSPGPQRAAANSLTSSAPDPEPPGVVAIRDTVSIPKGTSMLRPIGKSSPNIPRVATAAADQQGLVSSSDGAPQPSSYASATLATSSPNGSGGFLSPTRSPRHNTNAPPQQQGGLARGATASPKNALRTSSGAAGGSGGSHIQQSPGAATRAAALARGESPGGRKWASAMEPSMTGAPNRPDPRARPGPSTTTSIDRRPTMWGKAAPSASARNRVLSGGPSADDYANPRPEWMATQPPIHVAAGSNSTSPESTIGKEASDDALAELDALTAASMNAANELAELDDELNREAGLSPRGGDASSGPISPRSASGDSHGGWVSPQLSPRQPQGEQSSSSSAAAADEDVEKQRKQRANVVQEILATERDYVSDLTTMFEVFLHPLRQRKILSDEQLNAMFSNLEGLYSVNAMVLKDLSEREKEAGHDHAAMCVGSFFAKCADYFKIYSSYFTNQPLALATLEKCEKTIPSFKAFLDECMRDQRCRGLTFFSFLIKPIQRVCKYPLLLKELLKNTWKSHADYDDLSKAFSKIEDMVAWLNERKRLAENQQKVMEIQQTMGGAVELIAPDRRFVMEAQLGLLMGKKTHPRFVFLFSDMIVYGKSNTALANSSHLVTYRGKYNLNDIRVIDIMDAGVLQNAFALQDKRSNDKLSFTCESPEIKKRWVSTLKELMRALTMRELQRSALTPRPGDVAAAGAPSPRVGQTLSPRTMRKG